MRKNELRESVSDFSFGLLSTALNLSIGLAAFGANAFTSGKSPSSISRAVEAAANVPGISKDSLKRAFWKAQNRGLLKRKRIRGKDFWITTEQGKQRLSSKLPTYYTNRPWNGRLYLVTYDIPVEKSSDSKRLRYYLKKIGARRLQHSVYLILWDPTEVLKTFIRDHDLSGMVIVSDTGSDGSVGNSDLDELIWEVFRLEELNNRYKNFLEKIKDKNQPPIELAFRYLSILANDPQLPFELLGPTWTGDKAYRKLKEIIGTRKISFFSVDNLSRREEETDQEVIKQ